jgi:hypothetical protein
MQNPKIMKFLDRLKFNGFKIPQIINGIKAFALPRLDYSMMNSVMSKNELGRIDG